MERGGRSLSGAMILLVFALPGAAGSAKEGLVETVIRGVEHRDQAIMKIRSMKAVWEEQCTGAKRSRCRELFLMEGEKERIETFCGAPPEPTKKNVATGDVGAHRRSATTAESGSWTGRWITIGDGRNAYMFSPTGSGLNRGPIRIAQYVPGQLDPAIAATAGLFGRFGIKPFSWMMRQGTATVGHVPGRPGQYSLKVEKTIAGETVVTTWWIAPEYGYAVTRRQDEADRPARRVRSRLVMEFGEFKKVGPEIWLPHRYEMRNYVKTAAGWELRVRCSAVAKEIRLNMDIPDHYFHLPGDKGGTKEGSR